MTIIRGEKKTEKMKKLLRPIKAFSVWQGENVCTFVKCNDIEIIDGEILQLNIKYEDEEEKDVVALFHHWTRAVFIDLPD